jgi:hypothetical protein
MRDLLQSIGSWFNPKTSPTLWIELAADGSDTAQLYLMDSRRQLLLGEFSVRTYGDMPIGSYDTTEIRLTGSGTDYPALIYGPAGIVVLSNGPGDVVIQGGNRPPSTAPWQAGIRLRAEEMRSLVIALESIDEPVVAQIQVEKTMRRSSIRDGYVQDRYAQDSYTQDTYTQDSYTQDSDVQSNDSDAPIDNSFDELIDQPMDDGYC